MLTKHGLFRRTSQPIALTHAESNGHLQHADDHVNYVTPGHIAAIKSAGIRTAPSSVPLSNQNISSVSPLRPDIEGHTGQVTHRLVIGSGLKIKCGEIEDCDHLLVEGCVDALLNCNAISIACDGRFVGKAEVERADISGIFEGELIVRGLLVIRSSAKVLGKISYGQLKIEEGGELSGDISNSHQVSRKAVVSSIAKLRHMYG